MSEVRDKFTEIIVGAVEDLRLDFHVAMAGAQSVENQRKKEAELFSQILRQAGAMQ